MGGGNRARIDDVAEESAVVVGHLPDFEVFHETGAARGVDRTAVDDVPGKGPAAPMASKLMAMAVSFVAVRAPPLLMLPENSAAPTFSM